MVCRVGSRTRPSNSVAESYCFNADIGAHQALGSFHVLRADGGITFGQSDTVTPDGRGPVTLLRADTGIDLGTHGPILGSGVTLNAGASTFTLATDGADIRINGPVTLASSTNLTTGARGR